MARKAKNKTVVDDGTAKNPKPPRANFAQTDEMEKHFLDLCLREVTDEGYMGVSLTDTSWERVEKEFKEKWNVDYNHKQFRNRYDYLRNDFYLWLKLVGISGHGVGPITDSLQWPPQKWKEVIAQYPKAKKFRENPLKYFDTMQAIFEGTLAHGTHAKSNAPIAPADDVNIGEDVDDEEDEYFNGVRIEYDSTNPDVADLADTQPSKSVSTSKKNKKRRRSSDQPTLDQQIESFVDIIKSQIENEEASKGPSLKEANESLRDLLTLKVLSELQFNRAKVAFCDKPLLATGFMEGKDEYEKFEFLKCIPGIFD